MTNYFKLIVLGVIALLALIAANYARDLAYLVNALTVALAAMGLFIRRFARPTNPFRTWIFPGNTWTASCAPA